MARVLHANLYFYKVLSIKMGLVEAFTLFLSRQRLFLFLHNETTGDFVKDSPLHPNSFVSLNKAGRFSISQSHAQS